MVVAVLSSLLDRQKHVEPATMARDRLDNVLMESLPSLSSAYIVSLRFDVESSKLRPIPERTMVMRRRRGRDEE